MLALLPVSMPGMVLGLAYIFTFNAPGSLLNRLYGTLAILVVANLVHYFTVPFLTATTTLKQMDGEFENVSASLGVPFYRTFWRVTVPIALPSIVAISMYFFLNAMVTLSAVVFLVAPGTELAAVAVLLIDDAGETAQATAMSVLIIGIGLLRAARVLGADARRDPAHAGVDGGDRPAGGAGVTEHARAVVVGGGVIGASVAYHLARLGWRDVQLLERRSLTCGTTWHAAGLVGRLRGSRTACRLVDDSARLYARLPAETGQATGWRQCGSLVVARTAERLVQLRRQVALGRAAGIDAHLIASDEVSRRWPLCRTDDLAGAMVVPDDGRVIPADVTQALAAGARAGGVRVRENVVVHGARVRDGAVSGVDTSEGEIACEVVVNCAGMWARALAAANGVAVPLWPVEHFYAVTRPHGRRHARAAGTARPRRLRVRARGGRRPPLRRLRAAGQAVAGRSHPGGLRLHAASRKTGRSSRC